ncbi:MAG: carboxylating nicotinate-nucleotide diphosphorylase [Wenzhouxiangella sp.]
MKPDPAAIARQVAAALAEDIGSGDASAALIGSNASAQATLITRQEGVLAGSDWASAAFQRVSADCKLDWQIQDGHRLEAGQVLCQISGPAHALLTAERTALNFLQLLSGVATRTAAYVAAVAGTGARILDTRKTVPGLRLAQKYAVVIGGGHNHRMGLYDMVMLKENHILAAGGIGLAVQQARARFPALQVEVEVETLDELEQAIAARADRIMLDNFNLEDLHRAVDIGKGKAILEASGGINLTSVRSIAESGVDEISVGELTKRIDPLDLSLRFN